jgi:hypothetical protein
MKTMLSAITLLVLERIFAQHSKTKLGASTQMLYINCLTKHFKSLDCIEPNSHQFELFESDFPNFITWHPRLVELHRAGLINIVGKTIIFINVWGQYIDRSVYESNELSIGFEVKTAKTFEEELKSSQSLIDLCGIKYHSTPKQTKQLMEVFLYEQEATGTKYLDEGAIKKHFINWFPKNLERVREIRVSSQTKLLGDD